MLRETTSIGDRLKRMIYPYTRHYTDRILCIIHHRSQVTIERRSDLHAILFHQLLLAVVIAGHSLHMVTEFEGLHMKICE